jgi:nicotinamidase-related amidase
LAALVIIDMQRDFIEPGGFGETLGNDVSLLEAIVPACSAVLSAWREAGGLVVHTREAHRARPVGLPPGQAPARQPQLAHWRCGADGAHPGGGRAGQPDHPGAGTGAGRDRDRQAGQGRLLRHAAARDLLQQAASPTCCSWA